MTVAALREELLVHDSVAPTIVGVGATLRALPRVGATRNALMLIDAQVYEENPGLGHGLKHLVTYDPALESQHSVLERASYELRMGGTDSGNGMDLEAIIAVGGGSVLDAAKLLRLALHSPSSFRSARHAAATYGVALVPETLAGRSPTLTLIPSTLGTGSEASAVACLQPDGREGSRRLVVGRFLRADNVVLDAELTRTLGEQAIREGAAEIMLRLIGSYVGSRPADVPDTATEDLVSQVASLTADGMNNGFDDRLREALAVASAETHNGWALSGRNAYAAKHWYLANELSSVAAAGKVQVTFALLPTIWHQLLGGDDRLGDSSRLRHLWRIIADSLSLSVEPVRGATEWRERWGVTPPQVSETSIALATHNCVSVWGGERPALRGMTESDILSIYETSLGGS